MTNNRPKNLICIVPNDIFYSMGSGTKIIKNKYRNSRFYGYHKNLNSRKYGFHYLTDRKKYFKCGTIIFNNDMTKVILVKNNFCKNYDKWGFPKGHIKKKESFAECAIRETWEETGLKICVKNSQPKIKLENSYYYPIIIEENKLKISPIDKKEICEVSWFKIENMITLNKNRDLKIISKNWCRAKNIAKSQKKFSKYFTLYKN